MVANNRNWSQTIANGRKRSRMGENGRKPKQTIANGRERSQMVANVTNIAKVANVVEKVCHSFSSVNITNPPKKDRKWS